MARNSTGRLILQGTLVAVTPLHVGGHGEDVDSDLPLARNGAGRWYVPGTSLAGVLRQWNEQCLRNGGGNGGHANASANLVHRLWGYQQEDKGHASYVIVEDAEVHQSDDVLVEVRDGVGIDRSWGCAAEHIKYDRAVLPAGTMLPLLVTVEYGAERSTAESPCPTRDEALAMLSGLRDVMVQEELKLGAAGTRGLGRVTLQAPKLVEQRFTSRQGILDLLRHPGEGTAVSDEEIARARAACRIHYPQRVRVTIDWQPRGPLMVKAGMDGMASDMLPLVSGQGKNDVALVLPGSSIKGALRFRAECILRTLLGMRASRGVDPSKGFLHDVRVPLVDEVFGLRGLSKEEREEDSQAQQKGAQGRARQDGDSPSSKQNGTSGPLPGRGALSVDDCYAKRPLTRKQWKAILEADDDQALCKALDDAQLRWQQAYHVAVDRWTGGAAESFLYTVLEPHGVEWQPIRLELDLERIAEEWRHVSIVLLLFLLRDLAEGRLPLGFGTNRGLGAVEVTNLRFEVPDDGELDGLAGRPLTYQEFRQCCRELSVTLNGKWQKYLECMRARTRRDSQ